MRKALPVPDERSAAVKNHCTRKTSLSPAKLAVFEKFPTEKLKQSLAPGQEHCLKVRPDGTILDGHHRVHVLKGHAENINALPREVIRQLQYEGEKENI